MRVNANGIRWFTHILILLLLRDGLLHLLVLDVVTLLQVKDTVKIQASLQLADHEVVLGICLDALDGEAADPGVHLAGQHLRLGVPGLEVERLLPVESENLSRRHGVASVEDGEAGVLIRNVGRLLPGEFDGVVDDVVDGEVTNTENGREDGAAEGSTTSDGLVGILSERERLAEEALDGGLESRDTSAAADHLNGVNVLWFELGLGKRLLERLDGAFQEGLDELLELLALQETTDINVVHDGFDANGSASVGGQDLLELLASGRQTDPGLGVLVDVNLELLLELLDEMVDNGLVEVTTTKVTVVGSRLDGQLALLELDNGAGVVAVSNVDEGNAPRLLLGTGQIQLGDTVAQGSCGGVVHEAEGLEASDLSSIDDGAALAVGEPGRAADDDVGDGKPQLSRSSLLDLGEVHSDELGGGELLLLAHVSDLGADLALDVDQVGGDVLLLDGDIGIAQAAASETRQAANGVLEVGDLLRLRGLTEISALGTKADERPTGCQCACWANGGGGAAGACGGGGLTA